MPSEPRDSKPYQHGEPLPGPRHPVKAAGRRSWAREQRALLPMEPVWPHVYKLVMMLGTPTAQRSAVADHHTISFRHRQGRTKAMMASPALCRRSLRPRTGCALTTAT
jgi:hypothetical protein